MKRQLRQALSNGLHAQLNAEAISFVESAKTKDFQEGVDAILGRRTPRFRWRVAARPVLGRKRGQHIQERLLQPLVGNRSLMSDPVCARGLVWLLRANEARRPPSENGVDSSWKSFVLALSTKLIASAFSCRVKTIAERLSKLSLHASHGLRRTICQLLR